MFRPCPSLPLPPPLKVKTKTIPKVLCIFPIKCWKAKKKCNSLFYFSKYYVTHKLTYSFICRQSMLNSMVQQGWLCTATQLTMHKMEWITFTLTRGGCHPLLHRGVACILMETHKHQGIHQQVRVKYRAGPVWLLGCWATGVLGEWGVVRYLGVG